MDDGRWTVDNGQWSGHYSVGCVLSAFFLLLTSYYLLLAIQGALTRAPKVESPSLMLTLSSVIHRATGLARSNAESFSGR